MVTAMVSARAAVRRVRSSKVGATTGELLVLLSAVAVVGVIGLGAVGSAMSMSIGSGTRHGQSLDTPASWARVSLPPFAPPVSVPSAQAAVWTSVDALTRFARTASDELVLAEWADATARAVVDLEWHYANRFQLFSYFEGPGFTQRYLDLVEVTGARGEAVDFALETVGSVKTAFQRSQSEHRLASALVRGGRIEEGRALHQVAAERAAETLWDQRSLALHLSVTRQAADGFFEDALRTARGARWRGTRARALNEVAIELQRRGRRAEAELIFNEARATVHVSGWRRFLPSFGGIDGTARLAIGQAKAGFFDVAAQTLEGSKPSARRRGAIQLDRIRREAAAAQAAAAAAPPQVLDPVTILRTLKSAAGIWGQQPDFR